MATYILGITAYRRDSAAVLIRNGDIVAAAREESFSRRRGDAAFPAAAIDYCLREAQLPPGAIDLVVFCDLLQSGGGLRSLVTALRRTQLQVMLRRELATLIGSGRHALPPLALISYPLATVELASLAENTADSFEAAELWQGDAACAIGAALHGWHQQLGNARRDQRTIPAWLGPWFGSDGIRSWLDELGVIYRRLDADALTEAVMQQLYAGAAVGWLQGRQEFCARSFGARSILMAPRASVVRKVRGTGEATVPLLLTLNARAAVDWLQQPAQAGLSDLCSSSNGHAIHVVDDSAQPRLHQLLTRVARSGWPLLVSVDFRSDDEPLVATPIDAYRCAMRRELDCLVIEELMLLKAQQPLWEEGRLK